MRVCVCVCLCAELHAFRVSGVICLSFGMAVSSERLYSSLFCEFSTKFIGKETSLDFPFGNIQKHAIVIASSFFREWLFGLVLFSTAESVCSAAD